jgi:hypothetical protein
MIGSYAMSEILLCSHVPMERFFDGTDQENSKNTRRKGANQENTKKQEGKNGGKQKKRFFCMRRFLYSYSCVFHQSGPP